MRTLTAYLDGEPFIAYLEKAQAEGDADHIERNMNRIEALIVKYQERIHELAQLQYRARAIRDRHEPPAHKRLR